MGALRYGTSSWSEKAWVGPFYPAGTKPGEYLSCYATQFDTVEADNTYYAVPSPSLVQGWVDKTPDDFIMSAKFPRSIVHCGAGPRPDGSKVLMAEHVRSDTEEFLANISILGARCGPLVLQFPYFNKDAFGHWGEFLERLDPFLEELPKNFRYGVEIRNKWWLREELLSVLRRHNVALVLSELPYMPHPAELSKRMDIFTADFNFVRLIGDRKKTEAACEKFDRVALDKSANLLHWANFLRPAVMGATETFAYANNHYAGFGPGTIRELAQLVHAGDSSS